MIVLARDKGMIRGGLILRLARFLLRVDVIGFPPGERVQSTTAPELVSRLRFWAPSDDMEE